MCRLPLDLLPDYWYCRCCAEMRYRDQETGQYISQAEYLRRIAEGEEEEEEFFDEDDDRMLDEDWDFDFEEGLYDDN